MTDELREAAEEVVRLGNQPGFDDDEWEAAMKALEAALAEGDAGRVPLDLDTFIAGLDSPNHSPASRAAWVRLFFRDMQAAALAKWQEALDRLDVYECDSGHEQHFRVIDVLTLAAPAPIDAAWSEAEAALPEGWAILRLHHTAMMDQRWQAEAQCRIGPVVAWNRVRTVIAEGPTPAAALRALAVALRERGGAG